MKKIIFMGLLLSGALFAFTEKIYVHSGWNLKGTSNEIKKLSEFADKDIVSQIRIYRDGSFTQELSSIGSIKAGEGFWIYADKRGTLSFNTDGSSSDSGVGNPPSRGYYYGGLYEDCDLGGHSWRDWATNWDGILDNCEDNDNKTSLKDIKLDLKKGWNLRGTSKSFKIKDVLNESCVTDDGVYVYTSSFHKRNKNSSYYILSDMGFWVHANKDCTINGSGSTSNPPTI